MSMSERLTLGSDPRDTDRRAALAAGWKRSDIYWERLQETGNARFDAGDMMGAARVWRRAFWLARLTMKATDPRRATSLANLAHADRIAGHEARARARFVKALEMWGHVDDYLAGMTVARRARSSLYHLRMEELHWDTYRDNLLTRYRAFAAETASALEALANGQPVRHRMASRWRGEKPSVHDDTRKFLAAALLVGGGAEKVKTPTEELT